MENKYVPGEGPVPAELLFLGEAPGVEENKRGRPFIGKSGMELERYIRRALGLDRRDVYVTNLIKRLPPGKGEPTPSLVESYSSVLVDEIQSVDPRVIITLGRWATRHLLGNVDMEVVHGIPAIAKNPEYAGRVVVPIFHPAAGLHNTEIQGLIGWDFSQLRMLLDGKIEPGLPEDEYPTPQYLPIHNTFDGLVFFDGKVVAVDTEGTVKNPWGLSLSTKPGTARVARKSWINFSTKVILHNSMYDLGVLRAMGIELADNQFDDTMIKSYLLCVEPQGLKPLARRFCGMEMQSYEEVIHAAQYKKSCDYLWEAFECLSILCPEESKESSATSGKKTSTRKPAGKGSSRISKKTAE